MHGNAPAFRNIEHCQVTKALDALLVGLSDVAKQASEELGAAATEAQIVDKTIKLCLGMPCIHSERSGRMKISSSICDASLRSQSKGLAKVQCCGRVVNVVELDI